MAADHDHNAGAPAPARFAGHGEGAPIDLGGWTPRMLDELRDLVVSGRFHDWSDALDRVDNCVHPIRLSGTSERIDLRTGEVLSSYSSAEEPLGATYVRCGNRRASVCPSCSRVYAADTFQLIRAGVCGGKTVPASVAENPLVFGTVTGPSFGRVHNNCGEQACGNPAAQLRRCRHGNSVGCRIVHAEDAVELGQPLCSECYDYASQVVWQWWAPELWRRFTIRLHRLVAKALHVPGKRLSRVATVQYAKVAEYQRRGVIHFHALIRLDGPRTLEGFAPAPAGFTAHRLARLVAAAVETTRLPEPGVDDQDPARTLAFGRQLDVRPVRVGRRTDDPNEALRPEQVAGYLAKYATKSADDSGTDSPHGQRIRATVRDLAWRASLADLQTGGKGPYGRLGKWVHTLGFRGHFGSRSHRYAITLTALRRARPRARILMAEARASARPLDLAALEAELLTDDDDDTTLIIGRWNYIGAGWDSDAQRALALAAAARAREYAQWKAEQRTSTDS